MVSSFLEVSDMCADIRFRTGLGAAVILLCAGGICLAVSVVNYDNDPNLENAKQYDLTIDPLRFLRADGTFDRESYEAYTAKANRELAETHYLLYLQDVNDSFQRAAVYARLGEIFSGIADPRVAPTLDRNKARIYFRKTLEAEPQRIGMATLQARGFFATDPNTDEERFASYMDYYQWLLSIDEKQLKENWLPTRPPLPHPGIEMVEARRMLVEQLRAKRPPRPRSAGEGGEGGMLGLIKGQAETTAHNLVFEARGRMAFDPQTHQTSRGRAVQYLTMLVDRFPDTSAAKRAQAELAKIASGREDPNDRFSVP